MIREAFSALRHRNYLLLWCGTLLSNTGDKIDQLALNWLVFEMTGSAYYLALVNICRGLPIVIFTLIGGAFADRAERRSMMVVTQTCAMILALLLAILVATGGAGIWMVMMVAVARGTVFAFNLPTRQSLISELVPRQDLANAIALNSLTMNTTKVLGPALAGVIIASFGTAVCFFINGLSFVVVLATLLAMRFPEAQVVISETRPGIASSILEGLVFVRQDKVVLMLLLVAMVPTFFGQPVVTLLVLYVHEVFLVGAEGLGLLTACTAAGSVIGAFVLAARSRQTIRGFAMMVWLVLFGVALFVFGLNTVYAIAPLILIVAGVAQVSYTASNNTLLQLRLPDHLRGRVLSIMLLNRALVPFGAAAAAGLAAMVGAPLAMVTFGAIIVVFAALILLLYPRMRNLRS